MSLQWQLPRQVPADTAQLGQVVLRPQNVYRQIGDHFDALFPNESVFAEMYETTGRGAIPPLLAALVTVLQMLEKVPDRLASEYVATRIDWKYALHLALAYPGFHFSDLCAFRERVLDHKQERMLFEQMLDRLAGLGLIKQRGKMRTDSTHVLAVVERLSQLELVTESIRLALGAVAELAPEWVERQLLPAFREAYEQRQSEYGLSQAEAQRKLIAAGRDGFWFLGEIERHAPAGVGELDEVETLRLVLAQQFPAGPDGGPAKRPAGRGVIESPHEPQARRSAKRGQGWTGYKDQVTETCDEDRPHLIVDLEPTEAVDHDSPQLSPIQARLGKRGILPSEQYVDQGFVSGKNIADSRKLGIDLVGPPPGDGQGPEGFRQSDFRIDEENRRATCPAGAVSAMWRERPAEEGEPAGVQIRFEAATCRACPSFGCCTRSSQGRSLGLNPYREALEARRAEAETEGYRQKRHRRAGIEGTISELVRSHGLRRARYRGLAKLRLQDQFTAVAVNLKRLARWWAQLRPAVSGLAVNSARAA